MKKVLMYILLVLLIILLLLPPGLRMFGKDLYTDKKEKVKDVISVLNCTKAGETINTTYLNNNPYNFQYQVKGNYKDVQEDDEEENNNQIINDIKAYASSTYNEPSNITEYKIDLSKNQIVSNTLRNYMQLPNEQKSFYTELGFICTISNY